MLHDDVLCLRELGNLSLVIVVAADQNERNSEAGGVDAYLRGFTHPHSIHLPLNGAEVGVRRETLRGPPAHVISNQNQRVK